jgi:hypothetical protein
VETPIDLGAEQKQLLEDLERSLEAKMQPQRDAFEAKMRDHSA